MNLKCQPNRSKYEDRSGHLGWAASAVSRAQRSRPVPRPLYALLLALGLAVLAACSSGLPGEAGGVSGMLEDWVVLPGYHEASLVSYEVIDGLAIYQGDIVLGPVDRQGGLLRSQAVGIEGLDYRWPNGVIPFITNANVNNFMLTRINAAIAHWEQQTDFDFVPRTTQADFVEFTTTPNANDCSSGIGRQVGRQLVYLGTNCSTTSVIHEIGHVVGLYHEQARSDRDEHVQIVWNNVLPGKVDNFGIQEASGFDLGEYDYASIMHYGAFAFCRQDATGACVGPTIRTIPEGIPIGMATGLSAGDIAAARRLNPQNDGSFLLTNASAGTLAFWASSPDVSLIDGDFNGDGRTDLALVRRTAGWSTSVPVALSNGDGSFTVTNRNAGSFASWASTYGVSLVDGDFNGDGRTDLALVRRTAGWSSVPVALSNGDGSFTITNRNVGDFAAWASTNAVSLIDGDFNGDGRTDLALVRRTAGWRSVPVALSNGDGSFSLQNDYAPDLASLVQPSGVNIVDGDFNGDGRTDLALVRTTSGWSSVPVAFAKSGGGFEVENLPASDFAAWARAGDVRVRSGDFNGDGLTDLALVRRTAGWSSVPVAESNGDGSFTVTNRGVGSFASWASTSGVQIISGDYDGDQRTDLSLVRRASGWGSVPIAFAR